MPTYEMFWDCDHCGTEKLLGKTHRHCPACGSAQDPDRRYFPPEEEKVAVEDHRFVGADKSCASCDTPNVADAAFCVNCGAVMDETKSVGTKAEVDEGRQSGTRKGAAAPSEPTAEPEDEGGSGMGAAAAAGGGMFGCFGLMALGVVVLGVLCCVSMFWTSEATLEVTSHSWERSIDIEQLLVVEESDWCDQKPSGAKEIRRTQKERSTKKVNDGETCKTVNVDNGDGTFKKEQRCTPKTKSIPVMGDHCTFELERWKVKKTETTRGTGTSPAPTWPTVKVDGCARLGCTRQGKKRDTNTLHLKEPDGTAHTCDVMESRWSSTADGSRWRAPKRVIGGGLDCSGLEPAG